MFYWHKFIRREIRINVLKGENTDYKANSSTESLFHCIQSRVERAVFCYFLKKSSKADPLRAQNSHYSLQRRSDEGMDTPSL